MKAHTVSTPQYIFGLIIIAVLYFIVGKLGLLLAVPLTNVSPIYPASGLAVAVVLLYGYSVTPAIFVASAIMNITTLLSIAPDAGMATIFLVSCFTGLGAALQAAVAAALVRHFISVGQIFLSAASVLKFLLIGIVSCLISSLMGSFSVCISGIAPWSSWQLLWWTWWVGDAGGIFVVAPLLLVWLGTSRRMLTPGQIFEAIILVLSIFLIAYLNQLGIGNFMYLYIPCLIWAGARFQLHGATLAIFLSALLIVLQSTHGMGPLAHYTLNGYLILLILFIIVVTGTILAITVELTHPHPRQSQVWKGTRTTGIMASLKSWFSFFSRK